jgi:hypothetical protein
MQLIHLKLTLYLGDNKGFIYLLKLVLNYSPQPGTNIPNQNNLQF